MCPVQLREPAENEQIAVSAFLENARSIACAVDAELCGILGADCATSTPTAHWSGRREDGLSLCLSMLRYVRPEAGKTAQVTRVDRGISYILGELSKTAMSSHPAAVAQPPHHSA